MVCLFVQAINCGFQFSRQARIADLLHHACDRVPVALFIQLSELESCAERRAASRSLVPTLRRKRRKLEREVGELRFVFE